MLCRLDRILAKGVMTLLSSYLGCCVATEPVRARRPEWHLRGCSEEETESARLKDDFDEQFSARSSPL